MIEHVKVVHGDPAAKADVVVEGEYEFGVQDQAALGPEAGLAIPRDDGGVTLHVATPWLHEDLDQLAPCLGLPESKFRVELYIDTGEKTVAKSLARATMAGSILGRSDFADGRRRRSGRSLLPELLGRMTVLTIWVGLSRIPEMYRVLRAPWSDLAADACRSAALWIQPASRSHPRSS